MATLSTSAPVCQLCNDTGMVVDECFGGMCPCECTDAIVDLPTSRDPIEDAESTLLSMAAQAECDAERSADAHARALGLERARAYRQAVTVVRGARHFDY